MQRTFSVKTERIAHDGAAEAIVDGKKLRVFGMLPEEEGIVDARRKRGIFVGVLRELTKGAAGRKMPDELHYLACSPWQVMEYPLQAKLKSDMISELFGYYDDAPKVEFTPAASFYGYRTKIEFSFCDRDGEKDIPLSLAFHERGGGSRRIALPEGCALASERMNRIALTICERLRKEGYAARDLKTLVVRESKSEGVALAILYAKREEIAEFDVSDIPDLSGFMVFHSTEKSPASVPTKFLWGRGDDHLTEIIDGTSIRYSWDSFFQNNVEVFANAVEAMCDAVPLAANVLELYSGAGTIGLLLAGKANRVRGIEIIPAAVEAANMNALTNGIENYQAECLPAEKIDESIFDGIDTLLLDPPRAGLHPKLIDMIKAKLPARIIYLSCNPETQSRDLSLLKDFYRIDAVHGFDFYPATPHVESLLVLTKR